MKKLTLPLLATASILAPYAMGSEISWTGGTSTDYTLGANWTGGNAPANDLTTDSAVLGSTVTTNKPRLAAATQSVFGLKFQTSGWTFDSSAATNTLNLGAGGVSLSGGTGTINSPAATTLGSATAGNTFNLNLSTNSAWSVSTGNNLELYAVLTGSGNLSLSGGGELGLRGINSAYSGSLSVSDGTLRVRNTGSLGDTTGITTVSGTGTLRFSASGTYAENLVLSGNGTSGGNPAPANGFTRHGAIYYNVAADATLTGTVNLAGDATINCASTGKLNLNGVISGSGGLTLIDNDGGAISQMTVGGSNTYTGATVIDDVRIQVQNANAFAGSSGVTLTDKDGSRLDVNSFTMGVKALSGGGSAGGNVTLGTGTLRVGSGNTSTTYAGVISGTGNFEKEGMGSITLTGANTYGGTTKISGGTIILGASERIADTSNLLLIGGTLDVGTFTETLGVLDLDASSALNLGSGGKLVFLNSNSVTAWGSFTLSVTGSFVSGSSIRFGSDATGLDAAQLGLISIVGYENISLDASGFLTADVAPVPEPASFAALAGLGALASCASRRRRR